MIQFEELCKFTAIYELPGLKNDNFSFMTVSVEKTINYLPFCLIFA